MLSFTRKCNDLIKLRSLLSFWALSNWLWDMPSRGLHNLDNFEYYYKLFLHCKKIQVFLKIFRLIWNVMTAASKCSVVCMSISSCVCNRYWTFSEDRVKNLKVWILQKLSKGSIEIRTEESDGVCGVTLEVNKVYLLNG